jgi:hypothetical protein
VVLTAAAATCCLAPLGAQASPATPTRGSMAVKHVYRTAENYVIRNYPRYMTYYQQSHGVPNTLVGPATMGPEYGIVVAINDDTLYASGAVDLSKGPEIFTIPKADTVYSLLTLDNFGNVFKTTIPSQGHGTYALVPHGYTGSIPTNTTRVEVPDTVTTFIIRADKYSSAGEDLTFHAESFRDNLRLTSMAIYRDDPAAGATTLVPLTGSPLSTQMKTVVDTQAATAPTGFLSYLQQAVQSPGTPPLDNSDKALATSFDADFAAAKSAEARGDYGLIDAMAQASRDAHALIIDNYRSHTGATDWIHFDNVGEWGKSYLDRASLNEYIQYGNDASAAKYYDAFTDHNGAPLNGAVQGDYQLMFTKDQIPDATRFWSLTAYTPGAVELVPNSADKYVVAGYTPGLKTNADGSITIYIGNRLPSGAPAANWLPAPKGPFSLLLRVYGSKGNASGTYTPPQIKP